MWARRGAPFPGQGCGRSNLDRPKVATCWVLTFSGVEPARSVAPQANELKLAEQLVASIAADFDPQQWHNEYRERLRQLIAAKARGEKIKPPPRKKRPAPGSLAESLKASIAAAREKKVA